MPLDFPTELDLSISSAVNEKPADFAPSILAATAPRKTRRWQMSSYRRHCCHQTKHTDESTKTVPKEDKTVPGHFLRGPREAGQRRYCPSTRTPAIAWVRRRIAAVRVHRGQEILQSAGPATRNGMVPSLPPCSTRPSRPGDSPVCRTSHKKWHGPLLTAAVTDRRSTSPTPSRPRGFPPPSDGGMSERGNTPTARHRTR